MKKILSAVLLGGALSSGLYAQAESAALKNLQSEAKEFKHKKRYVINYDQASDQTNVFFHYATFKGVEEDSDDKFRTGLGAGFSFAGQTMPARIDEFALTFMAGPGWSFLIDRKAELKADGKNVTVGEGLRDPGVERGLLDKRRTGEVLLFKIGRADLETLAGAQRVELSLGGRNYTLKPEHQQIFKNIIALATP